MGWVVVVVVVEVVVVVVVVEVVVVLVVVVNAEERDIKIQATIDMELARMSALEKDVMLLKQTVHNHSVKLLMIL